MKTFTNRLLTSFYIIFISSQVFSQNIFPYPDSNLSYKDSLFRKIIMLSSLTGDKQPSGKGDIIGFDEGYTSFYKLWILNEIPTDEAICAWNDPGIPELDKDQWNSNNKMVTGLYLRLYFNISVCNKFLNTVEETVQNTPIFAQVRFLRAYYYSYLIDLFDDLYFVDENTNSVPAKIKRSDLFDWIINQLKMCESNMYEPRTAPYYQLDKAADWMLLARMYLNGKVYTSDYTQDSSYVAGTDYWTEAAFYAKKVIDSGYQLNPVYKQLFMADNAGTFDGSTINTSPQEIIFPVACDGRLAQSWGNSLYFIASTHSSDMDNIGTTNLWAGYIARSNLIRKFFPSSISVSNLKDLTTGMTSPKSLYSKDDRALFWAQDRTMEQDSTSEFVDFNKGYSSIKWTNIRADGKGTSDSLFTDTDIPAMRVAEAYLTYAEALLRGATTTDTLNALTAVNMVRQRAHAKLLTTLTDSILLDEWAREFNFEGRRRTDLIRFDKFGGNTGYSWTWKGGIFAGTGFDKKYNVFQINDSTINSFWSQFINVFNTYTNINTIHDPQPRIIVAHHTVYINNLYAKSCLLSDVKGRIIYHKIQPGKTIQFEVKSPGIYFFKAGKFYQKLIVH